MAEAGRPTDLTPEVVDKIKECILDGLNLKETANVIGKTEDVMYQWNSKNYSGIADKIEGWRRDYLIKLAEINVKEILRLGTTDKESLKVVQDTSKFVLETLKKAEYSKRTEQTGADGKDLIPSPIVNLNEILGNNGSTQNSTARQED